MINTLADARRYIVEGALKHVRIIGDFYHMNIEEDNLCAALHDNRDLLGHVHIAEMISYKGKVIDYKEIYNSAVLLWGMSGAFTVMLLFRIES